MRGSQTAAIRTTRHESSSVEYRSSHRQVSGTHGAEIRPCSAVCEWGRNERSQARLNRAPFGFKGLGVLTHSLSVWFGSFGEVKCRRLVPISFGSLASSNSPASSANLSAETPLIKPSRRHINLSEMIVVLARISPPQRPPLEMKTNTCWTVESLFAYVELVQGWKGLESQECNLWAQGVTQK